MAIDLTLGEVDYTMTAKIRQHELTLDEPKSIGGKDAGPAPFEMLAVGLAACTATTLRMYAARKEWNFGEISVHVEHIHNPAERSHSFARTIAVSEPIDEFQQSRLLAIANACPVHKTLEKGTEISTKIHHQDG